MGAFILSERVARMSDAICGCIGGSWKSRMSLRSSGLRSSGLRLPSLQIASFRCLQRLRRFERVAGIQQARTTGSLDTSIFPVVSATKSPAPKNEFVVSPQADLPCPVLSAKRIRFAFTPNQTYDSRVPLLHKGRFAIVTNARRDAMDANGAQDERAPRVRQSQVVPMPRRWHQALRKYPQGDGDKKARSPGRAWNKP